jgi:hypothetical protein
VAKDESTLRPARAQSYGTARCGPACRVVWQGRVGDHSPYADLELEDAAMIDTHSALSLYCGPLNVGTTTAVTQSSKRVLL